MNTFLDVLAWLILGSGCLVVAIDFVINCSQERTGKALLSLVINGAAVWAVLHLMVLR